MHKDMRALVAAPRDPRVRLVVLLAVIEKTEPANMLRVTLLQVYTMRHACGVD